MPFLAPVVGAIGAAAGAVGTAAAGAAGAVGSAVGGAASAVGGAVGSAASAIGSGVGGLFTGAGGAGGAGIGGISGGATMGAASSAPVSLTGAMGGAGGGLSQGAGQLASSGGMAMADTGAELGMSGVQSALEAPQSIFPGEGLGGESFAPSYTGAGSDITSGGGFFSDGGVGTGTPQSSAPLQTGQAPNADMGSYFDYTPQEGGQGMMQAPEGGGYFDYAGADYSGGSPGQSSFMDKAGDFWDEYGENIKSMAGSGMSGGGGGGAGGSRMAPPTPPNMLSGWGSGYAPMASPLPTLDYFMGGQ